MTTDLPSTARPSTANNEELLGLPEDRLLEMLFQGAHSEDVASRRAAFEFSRRQEAHRIRLQLGFSGLSAFWALMSVVAAFLPAIKRHRYFDRRVNWKRLCNERPLVKRRSIERLVCRRT